MILVQYFICIMAPFVLFKDSHILLGVVAMVNLFVHTWSFRKYLKTTGSPPGSFSPPGPHMREGRSGSISGEDSSPSSGAGEGCMPARPP